MNQPVFQQTLADSVMFSGKGLHTGKLSSITLYPAPANTGILFRKIMPDKSSVVIPVHWRYVSDMPLCTCLANEGVFVRTVEHLLSALYACRIDNAYVDIVGDEVPILDGSAYLFAQAILPVGVLLQSEPIKTIRILKPFEYREGDKWVKIEPADEFVLDVTISLKYIGCLNWAGQVDSDVVMKEFIYARTFGRLLAGTVARVVSYFRKPPVCLGANTGSAILLWKQYGLTQGGLRASDEYVRHRVIDLLGDLCLIGHPILAKVTTHSTAHRLNHRLLEQVFTDDEAWCWA